MRQRTFDAVAIIAGLVLAVVLAIGGGLLLNAYAWWQMGQIMLISAIGAFCAAGLFLILSGLSIWHLRRAAPEAEVFPRPAARVQSSAA